VTSFLNPNPQQPRSKEQIFNQNNESDVIPDIIPTVGGRIQDSEKELQLTKSRTVMSPESQPDDVLRVFDPSLLGGPCIDLK